MTLHKSQTLQYITQNRIYASDMARPIHSSIRLYYMMYIHEGKLQLLFSKGTLMKTMFSPSEHT